MIKFKGSTFNAPIWKRRRGGSSHKDGPVLVIGGAGYIGSVLVRQLLEAGSVVRVLDRFVFGMSSLAELQQHESLTLMSGDCRDPQAVRTSMRGVSSVIHLAGIVGDPACALNPATTLEINEHATRIICDAAKAEGVSRLIFASSCSVYGISEDRVTETSATCPVSLYAKTKVTSERIVLDAQTWDLHPVVLRFATVFGYSPRPRFDLVVNLLVGKATQQGRISIFNPEQWRPFAHVSDISRAILSAHQAPAEIVSGEVFNVGDNSLNYTLGQLAEYVREVFPNLSVEYIDNSDRRNYNVAFDKIQNRLGFRCKLDLRAGVAELRTALLDGSVADFSNVIYNNHDYLIRNPLTLSEEDSLGFKQAVGLGNLLRKTA